MVLQDIFVGRQPIFDRNLECYAYELLYRTAGAGQARVRDGNQATSQVVYNAFLEIGLDKLVGHRPAFFNVTRDFLLSDYTALIPPHRAVLEILEDVEIDDRLIRAVRRLRAGGYRIALDDFIYHPHMQPLVELADIIKIDLLQLDDAQVTRHVKQLRPYPLKLLAEKVETREQFRRCSGLGFEYFQGYFLCRPEIVKSRQVAPNQVATLRLLARLQDPAVDLRELGEIISHDLSLAHRMLRVINSAEAFLAQKVESISQAIVLLGTQFVAKLASLVILARMKDQPRELITTAITRARMCELLGKVAGGEPSDAFFLVGLFSTLDAILGVSLESALSQLPLTEKVQAALLAREGILGEVLDCVIAFERGDWDTVTSGALDRAAIQRSYLQAISWAAEMTSQVA